MTCSETPDLKYLLYIIPIAIALSIPLFIKSREENNYRNLYRKAKEYAIQTYGDKQPPLTRNERTQWYENIELDKNERFDRVKKLEEFLKKFE